MVKQRIATISFYHGAMLLLRKKYVCENNF